VAKWFEDGDDGSDLQSREVNHEVATQAAILVQQAQMEVFMEEVDVDIEAMCFDGQEKYQPSQNPQLEGRPRSLEHSEAKLWHAMKMDDDGVPAVLSCDTWLLADALVEGADANVIGRCHNWFVRSPGLVTPLLRAAWVGDHVASAMLIEAKADVDCRLPRHGATALHLSVGDHPFEWSAPWMKREEVFAQLLDAGADPTLLDKYGRSALRAAEEHGQTELQEQLQNYLSKWASRKQRERIAIRAQQKRRKLCESNVTENSERSLSPEIIRRWKPWLPILEEIMSREGRISEYNWLLFMHVEDQLTDGAAWKALQLPETISEMHVDFHLSPSQRNQLTMIFDKLDPGEQEASLCPRRGVIDVCDVHAALAAKCFPPWTTMNLAQWLELGASIKVVHGDAAVESVIGYLHSIDGPAPWWLSNTQQGRGRCRASCAPGACSVQ